MKPILLYYKIQSFQNFSLEYLEDNFDVIVLDSPKHDQPDILKRINVLFAPMGYLYDKEKIDLCEQLSIIATPTTGEHHIDTEYAKSKGIRICSLKNQQHFLQKISATAELTWGLIICLTRKILQAEKSVRNIKWNGKIFGEKTPKMLSEMSLGILGLGRLGKIVANYGKAFNMDVFYYDPYVKNENFIRCDHLHDLARKSDIVSVHVHLNEKTKNLVGLDFLDQMPSGSYLVNTSRGGIVNEKDLVKALEKNHLAGAAVDMLENEHLPDFNIFKNSLMEYAQTHDNVIITPKIGGVTKDSWEMVEKHIIDLIINELQKRNGSN